MSSLSQIANDRNSYRVLKNRKFTAIDKGVKVAKDDINVDINVSDIEVMPCSIEKYNAIKDVGSGTDTQLLYSVYVKNRNPVCRPVD